MEEEHRKNEGGADKQKEWGSVVEEIEIVSVGFSFFFFIFGSVVLRMIKFYLEYRRRQMPHSVAETGQAGVKLPLHVLMLLQGVVGFSVASLPCHEFGEIWAS